MGDVALSRSGHAYAQPTCRRLSPRSAGRRVRWGEGESGGWTVEAGPGSCPMGLKVCVEGK